MRCKTHRNCIITVSLNTHCKERLYCFKILNYTTYWKHSWHTCKKTENGWLVFNYSCECTSPIFLCKTKRTFLEQTRAAISLRVNLFIILISLLFIIQWALVVKPGIWNSIGKEQKRSHEQFWYPQNFRREWWSALIRFPPLFGLVWCN